MNAEEQIHLMILGAIAQLPEIQRNAVHQRAEDIRQLITDDIGKTALALVGAEEAAK